MWSEYERIQTHRFAKNKIVLAVYVTKENARKVADETKAFEIFNEHCLLTGFMSLQTINTWMIMLNPKGKVKKYIFESDLVFNQYFKKSKQ